MNLKFDQPLPYIDEADTVDAYGLNCVPAVVSGIKCHLCYKVPMAGGGFIVAPVKLRDVLDLGNGTPVKVEFDVLMKTTVQRGD